MHRVICKLDRMTVPTPAAARQLAMLVRTPTTRTIRFRPRRLPAVRLQGRVRLAPAVNKVQRAHALLLVLVVRAGDTLALVAAAGVAGARWRGLLAALRRCRSLRLRGFLPPAAPHTYTPGRAVVVHPLQWGVAMKTHRCPLDQIRRSLELCYE
jgi:hypothetical protein